MKSLAISSRLKLPGAMHWVLGVSITAAATLASAAPAEVALPGYYRIDRDIQLEAPTGLPTLKGSLRMQHNSQERRFDWEAGPVDGATVQRSYDSRPEHQCLSMAMSREDLLAMLRSTCQSIIGRPCAASEVQAQREGPDQWKLTHPVRLGESNTPQGVEQLRRNLDAVHAQPGLSPQQRAQVQAAMQQLPTASAVSQSHADLARNLETEAASRNGPEAEMLREQARRLRAGTTEPIWTGTAVQRWTRISNHCPKGSQPFRGSTP